MRRRTFLKALAMLALLPGMRSATRGEGVRIRNGWILRPDDE